MRSGLCHGNQIWCEQKIERRPRKTDLREACAGWFNGKGSGAKQLRGQHTKQNDHNKEWNHQKTGARDVLKTEPKPYQGAPRSRDKTSEKLSDTTKM
jgi:hypothetical protein